MLSSARTLAVKAWHRDGLQSVKHLSFLWDTYGSGVWYWECVECARRLLLSGALVFVKPDSAAQIVFAICVASLSIVLYSWAKPYASPADNMLALISQVSISAQLFLALLIYISQNLDPSKTDDFDTPVVDWLMIGLTVVVFAAGIVLVIVEGKDIKAEDEETGPAVRERGCEEPEDYSNNPMVAAVDIEMVAVGGDGPIDGGSSSAGRIDGGSGSGPMELLAREIQPVKTSGLMMLDHDDAADGAIHPSLDWPADQQPDERRMNPMERMRVRISAAVEGADVSLGGDRLESIGPRVALAGDERDEDEDAIAFVPPAYGDCSTTRRMSTEVGGVAAVL